MQLKRWFIRKLRILNDRLTVFIAAHDQCEICGEIEADETCIACEKRICYEHDSHYYSDESLCTECEAQITPEERAEDLKTPLEAI